METKIKSNGYLFLVNRGYQTGDCSDFILGGDFMRASTRLQLRPAFKAARSIDQFSKVESLYNCDHYLTNEQPLPRACIFSKITSRDEKLQLRFAKNALSIAAKMKASNIPVAIMYSDHHAIETDCSAILYRDLLRLADLTIFPSIALKKITTQTGYYSQYHAVIEDVTLLEKRPFRRFNSTETLNIIWFGHSSNARYLVSQLPNLLKAETHQKTQLTILTESSILEKIKTILKETPTPKNWTYRLKGWDPRNQPQQLQTELENAHICWLPSNPNDPRKAGASHNRLVDAITAGCITIASPIDSYKELASISLIGDNSSLLLTKAIKEQVKLIENFEANRSKALDRFQIATNSAKWKNLLLNINKTIEQER